MTKKILDIAGLDQRHPGLTPAIAQMFYEAASVCLARHHESPSTIEIEQDSAIHTADVTWLSVSAGLKAAYANSIDATEDGAYGLCLAAVELAEGLVAIQRAETLTGADYYLGPAGSSVYDLESAYRFEVSGVDRGKRSACETRLRSKVAQTQAPGLKSLAIAAVAGFELKTVLLSPKIEP
jgi:hypothetical protein